MNSGSSKGLFARFRITSLGTLASRLLGMLRDVAMAALLGISSGGAMDAFVIAFRAPDLFRRLFAEGALTASYLPVFVDLLNRDRIAARQLATTMLAAATLAGVIVVLLGEVICAAAWRFGPQDSAWMLLWQLTALLLPYVLLILVAAQLAATLHALAHFSAPALAPALLNLCWLAGVIAAPWLSHDPRQQVRILAVTILVAGAMQTSFQWLVLNRLGFKLRWNWPATRILAARIAWTMLPAAFGLAVTQINVLTDSMLAWWMASANESAATFPWWSTALPPGAASTVYYSERLIMFPLGLIGLATATAIFPSLTHHAAQGRGRELGRELSSGLQLVAFLSIPACAGLLLLAEPIVRVLLEHGAFTHRDTLRTASMIRAYSVGVAAYCGLPVIIRGYYALGDFATPVRIGGLAVAVNLMLNLALPPAFGETGLGWATSAAAVLQLLGLAVIFARRRGSLTTGRLGKSLGKTILATCVMVAVGFVLRRSAADVGPALALAVPLLGCGILYAIVTGILGSPEWRLLRRGDEGR